MLSYVIVIFPVVGLVSTGRIYSISSNDHDGQGKKGDLNLYTEEKKIQTQAQIHSIKMLNN